MNLQGRINILIQRYGLSRQELAAICDVSTVTVHKWLSGKANIKEEHSKALAKRLWVDWLWVQHGVSRVEQFVVDTLVSGSNNIMVCHTDSLDVLTEYLGTNLRLVTGRTADTEAIGIRLSKSLTSGAMQKALLYGNRIVTAENPTNLQPLELKEALYNVHQELIKGSFLVKVLTMWTDTLGVTRIVFQIDFCHQDREI